MVAKGLLLFLGLLLALGVLIAVFYGICLLLMEKEDKEFDDKMKRDYDTD